MRKTSFSNYYFFDYFIKEYNDLLAFDNNYNYHKIYFTIEIYTCVHNIYKY